MSSSRVTSESVAPGGQPAKAQAIDRVGLEQYAVREPESMRQLYWRRFRRHRLAVASTLVVLMLAGICYSVPFFVSEEVGNVIDMNAFRQPPSLEHPFGTDHVGRDMLLRTIYGGRVSLRIGVLAALIAMTIGITVGAVAGYNIGLIDNILMRFTEALMSIPTLFILIVLGRICAQCDSTKLERSRRPLQVVVTRYNSSR